MFELDEFELWRDRGDEAPLIIRGEARIPAKAKGTVVICHGFKGFAHFSFFPYLAKQLAEAGFRALTFDFSGSGVGEDRETARRSPASSSLVVAAKKKSGLLCGTWAVCSSNCSRTPWSIWRRSPMPSRPRRAGRRGSAPPEARRGRRDRCSPSPVADVTRTRTRRRAPPRRGCSRRTSSDNCRCPRR